MDTSIQQVRQTKAIANLRAVATDIVIKDITGSRLVKTETGHLTGTIVGQQVHNLTYQIRTWDDGEITLHVQPACGTTRHARTGGHYANYYTNLGRPVSCKKCSK